MSIKELVFDNEDDFEIERTEVTNNKVEIAVASKQSGSICPSCQGISSKVHSYYARDVLDLPMLDKETRLRIRVRKFYCVNDVCPRKIFSERFKRHIQYRKRMTVRVQDKIDKVALLMGGNGGKKLCQLMNLPVSSSTLIRTIHQSYIPEIRDLNAVGIDDWAYKKGQTYGTVVIDLERHRIIDLLPDREKTTVQSWLSKRPEIKVLSRDRYSNYASAATSALPNATQVADRWHLIKNLGDAVQRVLERCQGALKQKAKLEYLHLAWTPTRKQNIVLKTSASEENLKEKQAKMDHVKELHIKEGLSLREIARKLKMSRGTVRKYLDQDVALPKRTIRKPKIFEFEEYIINAVITRPGVLITELYEEIKAMGYNKKKTVGHMAISKYMPKKGRIVYPKEQPLLYWRPADVSLLLYRKPQELSRRDLALIDYLQRESAEVNKAYWLFQKFREMMENRDGDLLRYWVTAAEETGIKELRSFAKGVMSDFTAVQNALSLPWSNGQVEGQINKLKTIKRMMYGRASFSLLRKRLICMPV